jgi:hypothetical protein
VAGLAKHSAWPSVRVQKGCGVGGTATTMRGGPAGWQAAAKRPIATGDGKAEDAGQLAHGGRLHCHR